MKNIFNKFFLLCLMMTGLLLSCTGPDEEKPGAQKTATGISIAAKPTKTTYTVGENFDRTGLKVLLVYSDNTTQDVTARVETEGFSSSTAGDCTITVFYVDETNYFKENFIVTIKAKSGSGDDPEESKEDDIPGLQSISVATKPNKIVYYDDDTELDPTGLVVYATFSDSSKSGPVTNYKLSGFDSEAQYGKKTITVTYTSAGVTKEATFQITVNAVALSKIEVTSKPSKIYYELNENFSAEGMVVKATFNSGKVKEITDYTISEFDSSKIATVPITVSYLYKSPAYENDMKNSDNYTEEYVDYIKGLYTKTDTFDAYVKYMDASYSFTEKVTAMPAGTDGSAGTSATYVLFGDMPQTIKANDVVVNTVAEENGYYIASDGNYYAKVLENATQTVTILSSDGNTSSGGYDDTKTKELNITYSDGTLAKTEDKKSYAYFKVEPVKWRVATNNYNNKGKYLLVSEKILDSGFSYYNVRQSRWINNKWVYASNYEYSTVRNYLNGLSNFEGRGLVDQLFTEKSKALVCDTEVVNDGESTQDHAKQKLKPADGTVQNVNYEYVDYTCANTNDKLFLLSVNELTNPDYGFADTPELHWNDNYDNQDIRKRDGTDYALANSLTYDLEEYGDKSGNWWSRSPSESSRLPNGIAESDKDQNTYVHIYFTLGSGNVYNMNAFNPNYGIVPALCVDSL